MAQAADVSHGVLASALVCGVTRSLAVHHNFLPTVSVGRYNGNLFLLARHLSKPHASQTVTAPPLHILGHRSPPALALEDVGGFIGVSMRPQYANVALKEQPPFPG